MKLPYPLAIGELAKMIPVQVVEGNARHITGINEIHKVEVGDLCFVDHPKYYKRCLESAASVVMINTKEVENPLGKTLLISKDPIQDYNRLIRRFRPFRTIGFEISDTAVIGKHTSIAVGAVIGRHVIIGSHCQIHPNVTIYGNVQIGNNVCIQAGTVIGSDAFYYKRYAEKYDKLLSCGKVLIHDEVEIGANCSIDRGLSGDTIIGKGTKIDNHVHIGHGVVIGENCLLAAQVGIAGKTTIGNNVMLWGQVGVSKSLTIGDNAVVLAQSGVRKSLAGDKIYFGSPAIEARQKMKEIAYVKQLLKNRKIG